MGKERGVAREHAWHKTNGTALQVKLIDLCFQLQSIDHLRFEGLSSGITFCHCVIGQ